MKKDNLLRHPGPPSDFCIVYDSEKHRDISLSTEVDNDFIQNSTSPYSVIMVPLIYETNSSQNYDRILLIDEHGQCLDGDQILYMLAMINKEKPNFNSKVVGTILTNSGLESSLNDQNIQLYRSDVGDKNVVDMMKKTGSIIGRNTSFRASLSLTY